MLVQTPLTPPGLGADVVMPSINEDTPTTTSFEARALELLRLGDNARALELLERAVESGADKFNIRLVNMLFTALIGTGVGVDAAAVRAQQACAAHGIAPNASIFNNILAALDKAGPPEAVLAWLAKMRAAVPVTTTAANIALKAHLQRRDFGAAAELLRSMMKRAAGADYPPPPNEMSFNTVISALGDAAQPERAESVLSTMIDAGFTASPVTFTATIAAFAKQSRPADAARVLKRMLAARLQPDTWCFNAVLSAYANAADPEGARATLANFEARAAEECPNAAPDLVSYNTLMLACARGGRPAEAEDAFQKLLARGLVPNEVSYSTAISAHARAGNAAAAQGWLDKMTAAGIAPDAVAFNAACSAHARLGDAAAAMRCVDAMRAAGVEPTASTHAILVNALVKAGQLDAASASLQALLVAGERLSAPTFNTLISAYGKAGRRPDAEAAFSAMLAANVRPSLVTYNALASVYALEGDIDAAEAAVHAASQRGFAPDRFTYAALFNACEALPARDRRRRAVPHVTALLSSRVELTERLRRSSARLLGDDSFAALLKSHRGSGGGGAATRAAQRGASPSLRVEAPEFAPTGAEGADGGGCSAGAAAEAGEDDGWTEVQTSRRGGRRGKAKPPPAAAASATIRKEKPPTPRTSTAPQPSAPSPVRLAGVPLTRSKSNRARLLELAQSVAAAEAGDAEGGSPASGDGQRGSMRSRSVSSNLADALTVPPAVPLTRSAASELAITLGDDMRLE